MTMRNLSFIAAVAGLALSAASTLSIAATWRLDPALASESGDFTAALQAVLDTAADGDEVDGGGLSFRVTPGLTVRHSMTIRRLTLVQASEDQGLRSDPWRVLEVRGRAEAPLSVHLQDVRIDRGRSPASGHPDLAAGVWLTHVRDSTIDGLEVSGDGRGVGLMVLDSDGLQVERLHVHDMNWAPCAKDTSRLAATDLQRGWNDLQVHPMGSCDRAEVRPQRIREPLAGVIIARSQRVVFRQPVVARLQALMADGSLLPWQTDGFTLKSTRVDASGQAIDSKIEIYGARIDMVWEGIDVNGLPARGITVRDALVRDVHAFGIKAANGAQDMLVERSRVERAGLAGFVVSGDGDATRLATPTHHIRILNSEAIDTGYGGRWHGLATIAGFRFMSTARDAYDVQLERFSARDNQASQTMAFGVHAECNGRLLLSDVTVVGAIRAPVHQSGIVCH